jgi:thymidine phosphorylase
LKKIGDKVKQGEILYRIHAEFPSDFKFAQNLATQYSGYTIGDAGQILGPFVAF